MTKNQMPWVLKMLDVRVDEKFKLRAQNLEVAGDDLYCFDEYKGLIRFYRDGSHCVVNEMLYDILSGYYEIVKIPRKPKKHDFFYYPFVVEERVASSFWEDYNTFHLALKALGMVYYTQEEAEANLSKDYERLTGKPLSSH